MPWDLPHGGPLKNNRDYIVMLASYSPKQGPKTPMTPIIANKIREFESMPRAGSKKNGLSSVQMRKQKILKGNAKGATLFEVMKSHLEKTYNQKTSVYMNIFVQTGICVNHTFKNVLDIKAFNIMSKITPYRKIIIILCNDFGKLFIHSTKSTSATEINQNKTLNRFLLDRALLCTPHPRTRLVGRGGGGSSRCTVSPGKASERHTSTVITHVSSSLSLPPRHCFPSD